MSINEYLEKMKGIQKNIYDYIESEENTDESFTCLQIFLDDLKINQNKYDLVSLLDLIAKIANNHHHCSQFYDKLIKIMKLLKNEIQRYYSNHEIFNTFKSNKRILLFLIEEKIILFDEYIIKKILNKKYTEAHYPDFFLPEIKPFVNEKWFPKEKLPPTLADKINIEIKDVFYTNRKTSENDEYICQLIQKDLITDFISYINKNNYSLDATINPSIFESSLFLIRKQTKTKNISLIEYSAYFGSIQIFQYLRYNNVKLMPSLWIYAIHGKNAEIIHLLEECHVEPENKSFKNCFKESIKCHHNDFANYIKNNYLYKNEINSNDSLFLALKYHNFEFIETELINQSSLCYLCQYNYYYLIDMLFTSTEINVNYKLIYECLFFHPISN